MRGDHTRGVGVAQHRSGLSDQDLLSAFDNAPSGIAVLTTAGVIIACNLAVGDLLGREPAALVGGTFCDVTHPDDLDGAKQSCDVMQDGVVRVLRHECRFVRADGRVIWVAVSTSRVPAIGGRPAHLIMHIADITDRKRLEAELSHRALHDPLTGLANRTLLSERIRAAVARQGRHGRPSHLFYLDLDGFKAVNDRYGHAAGDKVLTELARRVITLLRAGDCAARLGGDEFAVLCEDTEPHQAASIAERLRAAAAEPFPVDGVEITLSAAVGSCIVHHTDTAALLREADHSMYESKRQGAVTSPIPAPRVTLHPSPPHS